MYTRYHLQITTQALSRHFSEAALSEILKANIFQDRPEGQFGHPFYHFDDSQFELTYRYLASKKEMLLSAMQEHQPHLARTCFGKITHAVQDFYAHSNYLNLWKQKYNKTDFLAKDILISEIITDPNLISGRFYQPWEWITFFPLIGPIAARYFPKDSHAHMNLDSPKRGELFQLAFQAAVLRTEYEYNEIISSIGELGIDYCKEFTDLP